MVGGAWGKLGRAEGKCWRVSDVEGLKCLEMGTGEQGHRGHIEMDVINW